MAQKIQDKFLNSDFFFLHLQCVLMFWLHLDDLQASQIQPVQTSAPDLLPQTSSVLILLVSAVLPKFESFCSPFSRALQQVSHCVLLTPCSSVHPAPCVNPSLHHLSPTNPTWRCLLWSTVNSHNLAYTQSFLSHSHPDLAPSPPAAFTQSPFTDPCPPLNRTPLPSLLGKPLIHPLRLSRRGLLWGCSTWLPPNWVSYCVPVAVIHTSLV